MTQKLYWTQYKNPPKVCENAECSASVTSAVPIAPDRLREYRWLCRSCARQHNENWNYKQGKSDADIDRIIRDDMCWNRPTQPFGSLNRAYDFDVQHAIHTLMGSPSTPPTPPTPPKLYHLPQKIQRAYATLELSEPLQNAALKTHYKRLVKKYHPDTADTTPNTDDKIKNINVAYDTITEYISMGK